MISVQKKIRERVPGFHFNLGFSGGHFLAGNEKEDEGDQELIKNADKFWWFSHMWLHQQPHDRRTLELMVEDLKKNLDFAKVWIKKKLTVTLTCYRCTVHMYTCSLMPWNFRSLSKPKWTKSLSTPDKLLDCLGHKEEIHTCILVKFCVFSILGVLFEERCGGPMGYSSSVDSTLISPWQGSLHCVHEQDT